MNAASGFFERKGAPLLAEREFEESGLDCCTRAIPAGHRCGYVAVPKGHPMFGMGFEEIWDAWDDLGIEVDGGITYYQGDEEIWVFGWDAAHSWHIPDPSIMRGPTITHEFVFAAAGGLLGMDYAYMVDADMAEEETRKLARQLAKMGDE